MMWFGWALGGVFVLWTFGAGIEGGWRPRRVSIRCLPNCIGPTWLRQLLACYLLCGINPTGPCGDQSPCCCLASEFHVSPLPPCDDVAMTVRIRDLSQCRDVYVVDHLVSRKPLRFLLAPSCRD
ncbi:hypothetical protein JAAARDRAFT_589956 [Jaapia argillacea MUCL 33604]|uniref:Hydrophobin n=1 Tax=Jaapia argillacea MUCL 33604 TaxID=933084 RepID=A0A067PIA3_9AGAM|nr:hypothetical protein JAAARDRAFT_589956 [Jaapia argillacea MUCL 33604]